MQELPAIAAVFLGMMPTAEFSNHGPENDKGFTIENQSQHMFVQVRAKGKSYDCRVTPADAFYVSALIMRVLHRAMPQAGSVADIAALLRSSYVRLHQQ